MSQFLLPTIDIHNLENYTFGIKEPQHEKDKSVPERLARMKEKYLKEGMRRSVDCILLVHQHGHPHVLLLQIGNNQKGFFKLYVFSYFICNDQHYIFKTWRKM